LDNIKALILRVSFEFEFIITLTNITP